MADDTEANADPSMEEILASIRKIISDDNPPAEQAPETPAAAPQEEVLELTQMIQEDGSVSDVVEAAPLPEPIPEPAPVPEPVPMPEPVPAPEPVPEPAPVPVAAAPVAPVAPTESLVSDPVATTAASTLSSLANTVEIERLASAPAGTTFIGNGHRTLEDMTIELMRPLLKSWLDQNLPSIVERLVQKEIERIARRS